MKGVLSEFYDLLKVHMTNCSTHSMNSPRGFVIKDLKLPIPIQEQAINDDKIKALVRRVRKIDSIELCGIYFPYRDSRDNYDYFNLLKLFKEIHFIDCNFYLGDWLLDEIEFFFQNCVFHNWFYLTPIRILKNSTNSLFSECEFKDKLTVKSSEIKDVFESSLFSGGRFSSQIDLDGAKFKSEPFLELNDKSLVNTTLKIFNCTFEEIVRINKVALRYLQINDTNFLSGFEITNMKVGHFLCVNTEMKGVFNAFESHFSYAKFERVKFYDVADFEKSEFGEANKIVIASYPVTAIFRFVTFMTASNFKKVNFYYGLDFENVDLREQPNFLKSNINPHNTNRETFRIIKYSFDSRGNTLEANRFFVQEMKAFKNELKEEGDFWDKLVYNVNDLISEFGRNYIRPIIWLIASLILYTTLLYFHDWYFDSHNYFIHPWFNTLSAYANSAARNFLPLSRFLESKSGFEFVSLLFYIWFGILIWQIVVAVKRHTQR
jgi:uncharacterized protein YjbI with pentapeptide repeats